MAVAVAPNPAIIAIPDGKEGDQVQLGLTLNESGARYDRLTYAWSGASGLVNPNTENPRWNRPEVSANREFSIRCEVTAHGDGQSADAGTTASRSDTEPATVLQVPDAVAPTGEVVRSPIGHVHERDVLQLDVDLDEGSGTYDTLEFAWSAFRANAQTPAGLTPFSNDSIRRPTFTCPDVGSDQEWVLRCAITARGTNGHARRSTFHTRTLTDLHVDVRDYPDASTPSFRIQGLHNGRSGVVQSLSVEPSGGTYDRIAYRWRIWLRGTDPITDDLGGTLFDDPTARTSRLTNPSVASNAVYGVRCYATVHGDDHNAEAGTTATDHTETDYTVMPLPDAVAPDATLSVARGDMRTRVVLQPRFSGGTYDRLTYQWYASRVVEHVETAHNDSLSSLTAATPTWTRPDVDEDDERLPFFIRLTYTAHGDGRNAQNSTSDQDVVSNNQIRVNYVNIAAQTGGFGVYVTDEHGNEIAVDAMFPSAQADS